MIDSRAQLPGGLQAGCWPFPEVWGQGRTPCGCGTTRQVLVGEGGALGAAGGGEFPEHFCPLQVVQSQGAEALPWSWPSPSATGSAPLFLGQRLFITPLIDTTPLPLLLPW